MLGTETSRARTACGNQSEQVVSHCSAHEQARRQAATLSKHRKKRRAPSGGPRGQTGAPRSRPLHLRPNRRSSPLMSESMNVVRAKPQSPSGAGFANLRW